MIRSWFIIGLLIGGSLSVIGQTAADSSLIVNKQLEEIEIVQQRAASFVEQQPERLVVEMQHIRYMPKFLGTSDPIRYLQSLAGVQTNNETTTGLHINGCDDYQSLVSINGAPVYYPNHLMGLYSTFLSSHFQSITMEPSAHGATMANRVGGWVDFSTFTRVPKRFSFEGNIGLINSDITFAIPMGKKHALWLSARTSYINLLYGRLLKMGTYAVRYNFQDYNLTYLGELTDKDKLVITGFYSRDHMGLTSEAGNMRTDIPW